MLQKNSHQDVVKFLIRKSANIYTSDEKALRWAAENGHLDVVKYLARKM